MQSTYLFGKAAEDRAAHFFLSQNYHIRERNYRYRKAEVDLIVQKGNLLVAVEVKARSTAFFGSPETFVRPKQRNLLVMAMDDYINRYNLDVDLRFDIMAYVYQSGQWEETHIENAFYPFTECFIYNN